MKKDSRYLAVQSVFETGKTITLSELFHIIPKTVVAEDIAQDYRVFSAKVKDPEKFTMADLASMGQLFGVDPHKLFDLMLPHVRLPKKSKRAQS